VTVLNPMCLPFSGGTWTRPRGRTLPMPRLMPAFEGERDVLSALHTIHDYPFDLSESIFARYPAMKLGDGGSVDHYAGLLAPIIRQRIVEALPADCEWVLTSPPLQGLPCGANLVCRAVYEILADTLPQDVSLRLDRLNVQGARTPLGSQTDFERFNDYSKQDLKTRQDYRLEGEDGALYDLAGFAGRRAVFVNDINVTGTQLDSIEKLLRRAGVRSLDCFLILNVDRHVGRRFPQLENEVNTSKISSLAEFTSFLRNSEYRCTGKLISRLLSYDAESLEGIFAALDCEKRLLLRRAILEEGIYGGAFFGEKISVVDHAVANG
jgi:hypothetical protein